MFTLTLPSRITTEMQLYTNMISFCDTTSQLQLSKTCNKLKFINENYRQTTTVSFPNNETQLYLDDKISVKIKTHFPNLKTLNVAAARFTTSHYANIDPLITLFQTYYPPHLEHVVISEIGPAKKEVQVRDKQKEKKSQRSRSKRREFNHKYFQSFAHSQLKSLKIIVSPSPKQASVIKSKTINSILRKSKNLRTLKLEEAFYHPGNKSFKIALSLCPRLESLTLRTSVITRGTITHLKKISHLKEINVFSSTIYPKQNKFLNFERFLCSKHEFDIEKLEILNLKIPNFLTSQQNLRTVTKLLPNLTYFSNLGFPSNLSSKSITNKGLKHLSSNCQRLSTLRLDFRKITDEGLIEFSKAASHLKKIWISNGFRLTDIGLSSLIKNCPKLQALRLEDFNNLKGLTVTSLIKRLSFNLLSLSRCSVRSIDIGDIENLLKTSKSMKHFSAWNCNGFFEGELKALKHNVPWISSSLGDLLTFDPNHDDLSKSFFDALSTLLHKNIFSFCDKNTKDRMTEVNTRYKSIIDPITKSLHLSIPDGRFANRKYIFRKLIQRLPNIETLNLATMDQPILMYNIKILKAFLRYLKDYYPKQLKHLVLGEIQGGQVPVALEQIKTNRIYDTRPVQFTNELFNTLVTSQLISLKILPYCNRTKEMSDTISFALKKAINLQSLTIENHNFDPNFEIQFCLCQKLTKLVLFNLMINPTMIEQLKMCRNITHLTMNKCLNGLLLEDFLFSEQDLDLRVLELSDTHCLNSDDSIIPASRSFLKNLTTFSKEVNCDFNDAGLLLLGFNCKNLTTLSLSGQLITNEGWIQFSKISPQLKTLRIMMAKNITLEGLCTVIRGYPDLEHLELSEFKHFSTEVFLALSETCKKFNTLNLWHCKFQDHNFQDLRNFVKSSKYLKHLKITTPDLFFGKDLRLLEEEFPHIEIKIGFSATF